MPAVVIRWQTTSSKYPWSARDRNELTVHGVLSASSVACRSPTLVPMVTSTSPVCVGVAGGGSTGFAAPAGSAG